MTERMPHRAERTDPTDVILRRLEQAHKISRNHTYNPDQDDRFYFLNAVMIDAYSLGLEVAPFKAKQGEALQTFINMDLSLREQWHKGALYLFVTTATRASYIDDHENIMPFVIETLMALEQDETLPGIGNYKDRATKLLARIQPFATGPGI